MNLAYSENEIKEPDKTETSDTAEYANKII